MKSIPGASWDINLLAHLWADHKLCNNLERKGVSALQLNKYCKQNGNFGIIDGVGANLAKIVLRKISKALFTHHFS